MIKGMTVVSAVASPEMFAKLESLFLALGFEQGKGWDDGVGRGAAMLAPLGNLEFVTGRQPAVPRLLIEVTELDAVHSAIEKWMLGSYRTEEIASLLTKPELTHWNSRLFTVKLATSSSPTLAAAQRAAIESVRQQLDLIPPPSKARYTAVHSLETWENPYLTVQGNMVTLHVLLADANPSSLGQGGMLRPVGARRRNLDVRLSDLPTALNAIPTDGWPYGRVIAVEEAHQTPAADRPIVRRNMESVIKTLNDLGVVVYEWGNTGGTQG